MSVEIAEYNFDDISPKVLVDFCLTHGINISSYNTYPMYSRGVYYTKNSVNHAEFIKNIIKSYVGFIHDHQRIVICDRRRYSDKEIILMKCEDCWTHHCVSRSETDGFRNRIIDGIFLCNPCYHRSQKLSSIM